MGEELPLLPETQPTDDEDVVWGLQTATALWARGERREALVWVRRAAEAAGAAGDDMRAVELAKRGVSMEEYIQAIEAAPPPNPQVVAANAPTKQAIPLISFPDPGEPRTPPTPAAAPQPPVTQPMQPRAPGGDAFDISDEPTSDYLGELDPIADRASMPLLLEDEVSHDGDELTVPRIDIAKMQRALDARSSGPASTAPKSAVQPGPPPLPAATISPAAQSQGGVSSANVSTGLLSGGTQPMPQSLEGARHEPAGPMSERAQAGPSSTARGVTKGPPPPPRQRTPTLQPGPASTPNPAAPPVHATPVPQAQSSHSSIQPAASPQPMGTTPPPGAVAAAGSIAPQAAAPPPAHSSTGMATFGSGGTAVAAAAAVELRATQSPRKKGRAPILDPWADDFPIDDPPHHSRASHHSLEAGPMSEDDVVTSAAPLETTLRRKPPPPPAVRPRAPAPGTVLADAPPNSTPDPLSRPNGDGQGLLHRPPPPPMRRSATLTGAPNPLTTPPPSIVTERKSVPPPSQAQPASHGPASQAPSAPAQSVAPVSQATPAQSQARPVADGASAQPTTPVPAPVAQAPKKAPDAEAVAKSAEDASSEPARSERDVAPRGDRTKSSPPQSQPTAVSPKERARTAPPPSIAVPKHESKSSSDTDAAESKKGVPSVTPKPKTTAPAPMGMAPLFGEGAPLALDLNDDSGIAPREPTSTASQRPPARKTVPPEAPSTSAAPGSQEVTQAAAPTQAASPAPLAPTNETPAASETPASASKSAKPMASEPPAQAAAQSSAPARESKRPESRAKSAPPGSIPPGERSIAGLTLDRVDAFADLPGELQKHLAATAQLIELAESEEVKAFGTLVVVMGVVDVAATIADIAAGMVVEGGLITERTSIQDVVPIRVVAPTKAKIAIWSREATEEALRTCPWVLEELVRVGDRFAALVGATMGPLGDLDDESRRQTLDRFRLRTLRPSEVLAEKGADNPGLVVVGGGTLLVGDEGGHIDTLSSGDLLFPNTVLDGSPSPHKVVAGPGGGLLLVAPRSTTVELFSTLPMLLELLRVA